MKRSQAGLIVVCWSIFWCVLAGGLFAQQDSRFPADLKNRAPVTLEEVRLLEQHVQQLIARVSSATVSVSGGSGVVISEDGFVLTAAHVNREAGRRVRITFPDGTRVWGETRGSDHSSDFGLIKITSPGEWPFVDMGVSKDCRRGEWCVAVGFPMSYSRGDDPAARLGRVLRTSDRSLMTDCTIMGGDSGGPLFNLDGRVIGIHSRVNDSLRQNFHIPIDAYKKSWDRLVNSEDWNQRRSRRTQRGRRQKPAYLGVHRTDSSSAALISSVTKGSAAERAGIQPGDIVLDFDGQKVGSFDELVKMVEAKKAGDRIRLALQRDSKPIEISLRLGSRE